MRRGIELNKNQKGKVLIVLVVMLTVLTYLLPTNRVVRYDFLIGQKWGMGTLVAPFDYPIYKESSEYKEEVNDYKDNFISIYAIDKSISESMLSLVETDFNIDNQIDPNIQGDKLAEYERFKDVLYKTIGNIYSGKIVEFRDVKNADNYGSKMSGVIRVLDGDELSTQLTKRYYTNESAKNHLQKRLKHNGFDKSYISGYNLDRYIKPNIIYNKELSDKVLEDGIKHISTTKGYVYEGTVIINEGELVSDNVAKMLMDLNKEYTSHSKNNSTIFSYIGNFLFTLMVLLISSFSISLMSKKDPIHFNGVLFIATLYMLMAFLCSVVSKVGVVNLYIVPLAIAPFYLAEFFNSRLAIVQYIFILLICSTYAPQPFEFISFNFIAGVAGLYFLRRSYRRNTMFLAILITFLSYVLVYMSFKFIYHQGIVVNDLQTIMWFAVNTVALLALLQLTFVFEKLFKFVTKITLVELCDSNQKLLKELSENAPGTFQHVLQVANITETAVKAIGGNSLLARTGSLYHDIGKMVNAGCFVENMRGTVNSHDKLSALESATIISSHVVEGMVLAKKYSLPSVVSSFITSHHGDSVIQFFYHKHKEAFGEEETDIYDFKYKGTPPSTREETVCMIADSVEAASRTLQTYDHNSVSELVDSIVKYQSEQGQYRNSELSFIELEKVKKVIIDKILDIYHTRIVYPK